MKSILQKLIVSFMLTSFGAFEINAQTIAGGNTFSVAVCNDSTVRAWGVNGFGQLGTGNSTTYSTVPVQVSDLAGVLAVACGEYHTVTLLKDSTVWAWGRNEYGALGNGNTANSNVPVQVNNLSGVVRIGSGGWHSLALRNDGTVWAWGQNNMGQIGNGTSVGIITIPEKVSNLTGIIAIAGGEENSLALKNDGTVWAWGRNDYGQLGIGNFTWSITVPMQVINLTGVIAIACGSFHTLAVKTDGTVWAFGLNTFGELGNGTTDNSNVPVQVTGLSDAAAVAGGVYHSLVLKNDSSIWGWGQNGQGQLGNGGSINSNVPTQVIDLTGLISVASGHNHSLATRTDGTLWAWGNGTGGELGNGGSSNTTFPLQVIELCQLTAAVNEIAEPLTFSVSPNPSGGTFTLEVPAEGRELSGIEIYNILGRKIHSISDVRHKARFDIDLSSSPKGIYIITVYNEKEIYSRKIVVQ